jgi:hypothetical protein
LAAKAAPVRDRSGASGLYRFSNNVGVPFFFSSREEFARASVNASSSAEPTMSFQK